MDKRKPQHNFTQDQINQVIELKKKLYTNAQIVNEVGVTLSFVKRIAKQNNLLLTLEQRQANSYKAKVSKNPEAMKEMRKSYRLKRDSLRSIHEQEISEELKESNLTVVKFFKKNLHDKNTINCPFHGDFQKTYYDIVDKKEKCPRCATLARAENDRYTIDYIKEQVDLIEGYTLETKQYSGVKDYLDIYCRKHGVFSMMYNAIQQGQRCPSCSNSVSKGETEVAEYVLSLGFEVVKRDRKTLNGLEIDVFVPSRNLAFEYNGLYWHCEINKAKDAHYIKGQAAFKAGVKLFAIFEDEWESKKELVKAMIRHRLGVKSKIIRASKLTIKNSVGFSISFT